jgi:hypothetical protein
MPVLALIALAGLGWWFLGRQNGGTREGRGLSPLPGLPDQGGRTGRLTLPAPGTGAEDDTMACNCGNHPADRMRGGRR